jgi:tetratricopeptide (TPR) repeat protein
MILKSYISLFICFGMIGCSSITHQKSQNIDVRTKVYTNDVLATSIDNDKSHFENFCPSDIKTIEKTDWTQLLKFANSCAAKEKWQMLEVIAKKLSSQTSFSPWGPYYLSLVSEKNRNFEKAMWMIDLAIKRTPDLGILYYQKGRLNWIQKNFNEGFIYFEKSVQYNLKISEPHIFMATLYLRDNEIENAQKNYEIALLYSPGSFEAFVGLAKISNLKGDAKSEMTYLEKAKRVRPQNEWVNKQLSILIAKLNPREPANDVRGAQ